MHDLVEWAAAQPWCDGNVGMIGISYFAMTQLEAAVEQPPHLKAIFPVAVTADLYEAAEHHGLLSSELRRHRFSRWSGSTSGAQRRLLAGQAADAARQVLNARRSSTAGSPHERRVGDRRAASRVMRAHYDPHPWDDLWRAIAVEHQVRDEFWDERKVLPRAGRRRHPGLPGL